MRRSSGMQEESPFPGVGGPTSPRPQVAPLQDHGAYESERQTDPPDSGVKLESKETVEYVNLPYLSSQANKFLDVQPLSSQEGAVSRRVGKQDTSHGLALPARPASLPAPIAATVPVSTEIPSVHYASSLCLINTAVPGPQSGQALLPGTQASAAEQLRTLPSLPPRQRKPSSEKWQHFALHRTEENVAVCKMCHLKIQLVEEDVSKNLCKAPLREHLLFYHPHLLSQKAAPPQETALAAAELQASEESDGALKHWGPTHPTAVLYNTECAWMLVDEMLPYSLVDTHGFRKLMRTVAPKWKVPGQSFFEKQAVPALEKSINGAIEQDLKRSLCSVVHFTMGGLATDPTCYLSLLAHWVTDIDGVLCRRLAVAAVFEVQENNMPGTIALRLEEVRARWLRPLRLEMGYVTTTSWLLAKEVEGSCLGPLICPAKCLSRLLQDVMERSPTEWLQVLEDICRQSHLSSEDRVSLHELQSKYGLPHEQLPEEMPTSWQAILHVVELLLAQEPAFRDYMENIGLNLAPEDWSLMYHLVHLLKPFEDAISMINKGNATLGQILHVLHVPNSRIKGFLQQLQQERDASASALVRFASELLQSLESSRDLETIRADIIYQNAAFLHPHFRDCTFIYSKGDVELGREQLKARVILLTEKEYLRSFRDHAASSSIETEGQSMYCKAMEVARQELDSYLQDQIDLTQLDLDPLVYWNAKQHAWPFLSQVAFQYFSCPATTFFADLVLDVEGLFGSGKFQERLALISLNADWVPAEFRVPPLQGTEDGLEPED
ncbi:zinc finger BED domain-containing protein 4-like [Hemicordylus capensis]|uniref:zinc finger BED domain-containing protein 4-like n=1 Tax=Hemicordylus capensis TaxID=884348 RepID=UPI0023036789|nr:zinc finger BED domain-containing protein 4-like [Hemicordylus capensis]XP_053104352.1 zinc finger BED domain-containing protein 4-like [Hemicordylus capensis]